MLGDDALIPRRRETGEIPAVLSSDFGRSIAAELVCRFRNEGPRDAEQVLRREGRRDHLLVGDECDALRMVEGEDLREVEVRRFPELLREVEQEPAVFGMEPVARNDQPLPRVGRGLVNAVVQQAGRAAPEGVGHETPPLAVEGVEERARALELLDFLDDRADGRVESVLRHAVGPDDPQDVGLAPRAEAHVRHR